MRPLQSLLLLILLAALGLGGYWLVTGGDSPGGIAPPLPAHEIVRKEEARPDANLETPTNEAETSRVESVEPANLASPEVAVEERQTRMIRGTLTDVLGNAIEGARVFVAPKTGMMGFGVDLGSEEAPVWIQREEGLTDAAGKFEVEAPPGPSINVAVRQPGFAPLDKSFSVKERESHDVGRLEMEDSAVLSGRVVDSRGVGVAGAELRALAKAEGEFEFLVMGPKSGRLLCETDAQGVFRIDQLASGPYSILIVAEDHPESQQEGETERAGSQQHDLRWELADGLAIRGRIANAPEDRIKSTWIRAVPKNAGFGTGRASQRTSELGPDGSFYLKGLAENVEYRISAREGERQFWAPVRSDSVTAKAGDRDVLLQWRLESALVFRVVDARSGAPIEKFGVKAGIDWPEPLMGEDGEQLEHHPDGRVRFAGLGVKAGGSTAQLSIDAVGYSQYERKGIEMRVGEELELGTIRLEPVPFVRVRVVDDTTSEPIARARVTMRAARERGGMELNSMAIELEIDADGMIGGSGTNTQTERTDEEGIATFSSLPGKTCEFSAKRKGYANAKKDGIRLSLSEDVDVEIRMRVGGTVVVTVVDSNGEPVAGANVEHRSGEENSSPMNMIMSSSGGRGRVTDSEGKKRFEHLAAGQHRFRLGKGGGPGAIMMTDGAVGGFVMESFSSTAGGEPKKEEWEYVEVADRAVAEVTLVAPAKSALFGKIVESGRPLAGAKVRLVETDDEFGGAMFGFGGGGLSAKTDSKGEFRIEGADVGEYDVIVTHSSRAMSSEFGAELIEGENDMGTLDLFVCILEGRVTNQEGDPIEGVRIEAQKQNSSGESREVSVSVGFVMDDGDSSFEHSPGMGAGDSVRTDADGRYRLRGLPPHEELIVVATGDNLQEQRSEPVILNPDDVRRNFDLSMKEGGRLTVIAQKSDGSTVGFCLVEAKHVEGEKPLAGQESSSISQGDRTTLEGLAPGTWAVTLRPLDMSSPGNSLPESTEPHQVQVVVGQTAEVTVPIP